MYVFDTFAILAYFLAESGGGQVKELLRRAEIGEISLAMSFINVGEVFYILSREQGRVKAHSILADLRSLPIQFYDAAEERILAAAQLKAEYSISYADAFAASLAQELGALLVTGDPEFKAIKEKLSLFWLDR
ncbi:MAG: type II toxin-antitoxin system VapC family toxin [Chloroflexi bacterium]|nr:type II toxin-antitoxin system VapC family toxin [Chloroflexota bacterium]MDL1943279.1 type II toxin-antitoxin system VapC family toxin [Chloroflexi bacterium CFX2]